LWEAAKGLPVELVRIEDLPEVLTDSWVKNWDDPNDPLVKCEAERTATADLAYPVILHPDGELMDGYHRVCKALQLGFTHVQAVRLTYQTLPSPDNDWA
jgi:alkylhydroperoxidase family enzyme